MTSLKQQVLQNMSLTPKQEKFLIFHLKCILYDSSKMLMFLIFFGLIHRLSLFIFAYIVSLPLRRISGGLHFRHYLSCLVFSFVYFAILVLILASVSIPAAVMAPVLILCTIIIYAIGPIRAPTRPPVTEDEKAACRKKSMFAVAYALALTIFAYYTGLINPNIGYWAVILHTVQLSIAYINKNIKFIKKGGEIHD